MLESWPELLPGERRILGVMQANPGITQRDLGQRLDLPQQTLSRYIADLIAGGWLRGGEWISSGRRGHPSQSLAVVPERMFSLGVSIMADAVAVMLVDLAGNQRAYRRYRLGVMSRKAVLDATEAGLEELTREAGIAAAQIPGIGIAVTGFLSPRHTFNTPRSLDEWADVAIEPIFAAHFGRDCWADNDANTAAVGEALVGVGRWARHFAYLSLGIGFGGGIIADGVLLRGRHGNAGEFGAMLHPGFHLSPSLELLRQTMAQHGAGFPNVGAMLENFDADAPGVAEWIAKVADSLSYVCAGCMAILDPDAIVLGGRTPRTLAERIIPHIAFPDNRRRGRGREAPPVVPAEASGDLPALGAALLPLQMRVFGGERR